jgi:magnesium transporter
MARNARLWNVEPRAVAGSGEDLSESAREAVVIDEAEQQKRPRRSQIEAWLFRADEEPRAFDPSELQRFVADDKNFAWVDIFGLTEKTLRNMSRVLGLHRPSVDVLLARWQRPKLLIFGEQYLVTVTLARLEVPHRVRVAQIGLFVGRNYLVSVHWQPLPFYDRLMARAWHNPELSKLDSAFMLYMLLDELLEYGEGLNEQVESEIERMEERALTDTSDTYLEDLLHFKRYVFALSQLAGHHREVFAAFLRPDFGYVSGEGVEPYFRDLEDRLVRQLDELKAEKDAVNGAFNIYVSHVSHRTNYIMKVLTIVSVTVLPATVIIGIFSTDIQGLPLYKPIDFVLMLLAMVLVSGALVFYFHRRGWL